MSGQQEPAAVVWEFLKAQQLPETPPKKEAKRATETELDVPTAAVESVVKSDSKTEAKKQNHSSPRGLLVAGILLCLCAIPVVWFLSGVSIAILRLNEGNLTQEPTETVPIAQSDSINNADLNKIANQKIESVSNDKPVVNKEDVLDSKNASSIVTAWVDMDKKGYMEYYGWSSPVAEAVLAARRHCNDSGGVRWIGQKQPLPRIAVPIPICGQPLDAVSSANEIPAVCLHLVYKFASSQSIHLKRCEMDSTGKITEIDMPPISRNLIEEVQRGLNKLGFQAGSADGLMGLKTRTAIKKFQHDQQLPTDGKISFFFLDHLQTSLQN